MSLWFFMTISTLFIPSLMFFLGRYLKKGFPRNINNVFGYRTSMSMKNKETWEFANKYCGKVWTLVGRWMFLISLIIMLIFMGETKSFVLNLGSIMLLVQCGFLVATIFPVERALRKNFDSLGRRKS